MERGPQWEFAPFRLDPNGWMLWHGNQPVALPPRAFSVLCYLVEHAGALVTKDELLDAVWQHRFVSESVLKVCINELRRTLDDSAKTPRYIETVSRRGYRFIADLTSASPVPLPEAASSPASLLIGREEMLRNLRGGLAQALRGERQVVFVTVAAGLGDDAAVVEAQCEELARRHQFIRDCGFHRLPNGEVAVRYGFIHALYQNVLYERVSAVKRAHLHRRVGEREEELYGERAGEIAAELAMHFERGRDYRRAVKHLVQATETAIRRFAHREAVVLARQGLELLQTLPDTSERVHQELRLHIALGVSLTVTQGYAAPDVGRTYAKALV